jgi:hypothetical protein
MLHPRPRRSDTLGPAFVANLGHNRGVVEPFAGHRGAADDEIPCGDISYRAIEIRFEAS